MAKSELGLKRTCPACGVRFYDLNKNPASCPSCGKEFDPLASSSISRSKRSELPKNKPEKVQEMEYEESGSPASNEVNAEDDDAELEDIDGMDGDAEDDEVFQEDMEDGDDFIGDIDKTSDQDGEEI